MTTQHKKGQHNMRTAEFEKTIVEEIKNANTLALANETALTIEELFSIGRITERQHYIATEMLKDKMTELKGQNTMANTEIEKVECEIVEISAKDVNATIRRVQSKINSIEKGYIAIIGDVAKLKAADAHKQRNFKNFYIMCQELFGMSRGTVHNLLSIYERFGNGNWELTDEAKTMTVRQMLETIKNENNPKIETTADSDADGDETETETSESKNVSRETLATLEITTANVDEVFEAIKSALSAGEADGELTFKITISK